jgi:putative membrane protein
MHLGRKYRLSELLVWTRTEIVWLLAWSTLVTLLLVLTRWNFLEVPATLLAIVGTAVAVVLGFKNQQCFARVNEALTVWSQITATSQMWAIKLIATVGQSEEGADPDAAKVLVHRHLAWLTALRFLLRARKVWENTFEAGNARYMAGQPTPESQSTLDKELAAHLAPDELARVIRHRGEKETLLLQAQYGAVNDLYRQGKIDSSAYFQLSGALDELMRLQAHARRIKDYPYARNYYSITLVLVKAFVILMPFGLFPYFREAGAAGDVALWTAWLNVPASLFVGWAFLTLEKVGENSSNPFEGGANDVPISTIARRIEIELRTMLGDKTDLAPFEPKANVLL